MKKENSCNFGTRLGAIKLCPVVLALENIPH